MMSLYYELKLSSINFSFPSTVYIQLFSKPSSISKILIKESSYLTDNSFKYNFNIFIYLYPHFLLFIQNFKQILMNTIVFSLLINLLNAQERTLSLRQSLCAKYSDCPYGKFCQNGLCIDNCFSVKCQTNQKCINGFCFPTNGYCYIPNHCPIGFYCNGFRCQDRCTLIECDQSQYCVNGTCILSPVCLYNYQCSTGMKCVDRQCVDLCTNIKCPPKQICRRGNCVYTDRCAYVFCPKGTTCSNGACRVLKDKCTKKCSSNEICVQGECKKK